MHRPLALLSLLALLLPNVQAEERGPEIPDYPAAAVAQGSFVIHGPLGFPTPKNQGFMNNPGWVSTSAGVVVVDPGSSVQSGEMVLRVIAKYTEQPVVAVFNTHIHGDHWLGNQAIMAAYPEVAIYGHPNMIEAIDNGVGQQWVDTMDQLTKGATRGTRVVAPTQAVRHGEVYTVGDVNFVIHHYGKAHTLSDIMIEARERKLVFLGDNVLYERLPRIEDGDVLGNVRTIDEIMKLGKVAYVPGHGKTGGIEVPQIYQEYLQTLYKVVRAGFEDDMESFEITDKARAALAEFGNWDGFEEQIGKHVSVAYLQIEAAEF